MRRPLEWELPRPLYANFLGKNPVDISDERKVRAAEQRRQWKRRHPDLQRDYNRKWREKNRPRLRRNDRSYKKAHKVNKRDHTQVVVYVIRADRFIKVGIAEDIRSRLIVFRTHCPLPVEVAYCSKPMLRPAAREIEVACHTHLIERHIRGEWFEAKAEDAIRFLSGLAPELPKESPVQLRLVS